MRRTIRLFGWAVGGAVALVGIYLMYVTVEGGGGVADTQFLVGFVWAVVGGLFVLFSELLASQVFGRGAR